MNDMSVSMLLRADADQARAALTEARDQVAAVGQAATQASEQAAGASQKVEGEVARQSTATAGAVGNLVAQFNDIGVMLASGQNPLQLALQQGTQITQVFGQMGATGGGALRMIAQAFTSLLSPMNLVTLGVIALGSTAVNWLMSMREETVSAEDAVTSLGDSVETLADRVARAAAPMDKLREQFGAMAGEARRILREQAEQDLADSLASARAAAGAIAAEFGVVDAANTRGARLDRRQTRASLRGAAERVAGAEGLDQTLAAAQQLETAFRAAAEASGEISDEEARVLGLIQQQVLALSEAQQQRDLLAAGQQDYANQLLADLQEEARLAEIAALWGRDSAEYAAARADSERSAFREMVAGLDISEDLRTSLIGAWESARGSEGATIAWANAMAEVRDRVSDVMDGLSEIGGGLLQNAARQAEIDALRGGASLSEARRAAARSEIEAEFAIREQGAQNWFERAQIWAEKRVALRGLELDAELEAEREAARDRERIQPGGDADAGIAARAAAAGRQAEIAALRSGQTVAAARLAAVRAEIDAEADMRRAAASTQAERDRIEADRRAALNRAALDEVVATERQAAAEVAQISAGFSDGWSDAFADILRGAKSAGEAFQDFGNMVLDTLARIAASRFTEAYLTPLFDAFAASIGGFFADGGVPAGDLGAYSDTVQTRPFAFAMAGGKTGVAAEAGPEAIMPLVQMGGTLGVRAAAGGRSGVLPLTRLGGKLAVQMGDAAFADGDVIGTGLLRGPGWTPARAAPSAGSTAPAGRDVAVNVYNNAAGVTATTSERMEGNTRVVEVLLEQVEQRLAGNITAGRGPVPAAIGGTYGLGRAVR